MKKIVLMTLVALLSTPMAVMADMDRCVSCHGVDFEKKALGNSKIVKNMSEKEIKAALDGYKMGEGGLLKDIMIKEVNLGVDTDAMSADVYNEAQTEGFEEPSDEFIFQKRISVRTLHKIKMSLKKVDATNDLSKVISQMKSAAFTMYAYDETLQKRLDLTSVTANEKPLGRDDILKQVSDIKVCVDHSFSDDEIVKCRVNFLNLTASLAHDEAKRMKEKAKKAPIFTGEGAVDLEKYLKH